MKPLIIDLRTKHHLVQKVVPICPGCNVLADGATGPGSAPSDGSISVCQYCGTISCYIQVVGGMQLQKLSDVDLIGFSSELRMQISVVVELVGSMLAKKGSRSCRVCQMDHEQIAQKSIVRKTPWIWTDSNLCSFCKAEQEAATRK